MLDRFRYPRSPYFPQIVVFVLWVIYLLLFGLFHNIIGNDLVALAFLPVIVAGWYFGATGGVLIAVLTIFVSGLLPVMTDRLSLAQAIHFAGWLNDLVLILTGLVFGRLGNITREHRASLIELQEMENERSARANFISALDRKSTRLNSSHQLISY